MAIYCYISYVQFFIWECPPPRLPTLLCFLRLSFCEVVFLLCCLYLRSSSCEVTFLWGCLFSRSFSWYVVFQWDCLPARLSSCKIVFLWGHLPVGLSSCKVVFHAIPSLQRSTRHKFKITVLFWSGGVGGWVVWRIAQQGLTQHHFVWARAWLSFAKSKKWYNFNDLLTKSAILMNSSLKPN